MEGKSYEPPRTADKGTLAPTPTLTPSEALEMHVRAAERAHDDEKEFGSAANSAAVKTAEEAIKAALLINGGSSVAMLAFIGTLVSRDVRSAAQLTTITKPLLCFGCGVAASVLAAAAAYFTNLGIGGSSSRKERSYVEPFLRPTPASIRSARLGEVFRWAGIISVTVSIGCFIWGLASAEIAFRNLTPAKARTGICKARTGIYKVIAKPSRAGLRVACRIMTVRAGSGPMRGAVRRDGGLLGASE